MVDLASDATSERGYLTIGGQATRPFLSAPHQILWIDDMIVVTNTGRNALAKVNHRDHSVIQRRYDAAMWDRLSSTSFDGSHLNSLHRHGDTLYAVAHNFRKGSYILELDWPTLEEKARWSVNGATGIHNLWIDEAGRFITCDSSNGRLMDADTADVLWSNQQQGYAEGIGSHETNISWSATVKFPPVPIEGPARPACGSWISFRTLDYQYLGHYGAVHEVRIVDAPDLCHHGKTLSAAALDRFKPRSRRNQRNPYGHGSRRSRRLRSVEGRAGCPTIHRGRSGHICQRPASDSGCNDAGRGIAGNGTGASAPGPGPAMPASS